jgi:hypothetical protein
MKAVNTLINIEFHKKQIRLVCSIITGMEADIELSDLIFSQAEPAPEIIDAILDRRNTYPEIIKNYQQLFFESKQALEDAGIDYLDFVYSPQKVEGEQIAWEQRLGIRRFTRWQYFWKRLWSAEWKRID